MRRRCGFKRSNSRPGSVLSTSLSATVIGHEVNAAFAFREVLACLEPWFPDVARKETASVWPWSVELPTELYNSIITPFLRLLLLISVILQRKPFTLKF